MSTEGADVKHENDFDEEYFQSVSIWCLNKCPASLLDTFPLSGFVNVVFREYVGGNDI